MVLVVFGYLCNGMIRLNNNYPYYDDPICMITPSNNNNSNKVELMAC